MAGDVEAAGLVLPEPLRAKLLMRSNRIQLRANQILITAGSEGTSAYLVLQGKLSASLMNARGREMTFRDIEAGMLFGELAPLQGGPRSTTVTALMPTVVAEIAAAHFLDFLENEPGAGLWLARGLAAQLRRTTDHLFSMGTLSVAARIQGELLRLAHANGQTGDRIEILNAPTHSAIAARVGSHREAVTRELRGLAGLGVVAQKGRTLTILSIEKLQREIRRSAGEDRF